MKYEIPRLLAEYLFTDNNGKIRINDVCIHYGGISYYFSNPYYIHHCSKCKNKGTQSGLKSVEYLLLEENDRCFVVEEIKSG